MRLADVGKQWNEFGRQDPLFAILTWPHMKRGGWDEVDFFETGSNDVDNLMSLAHSLKPDLSTERALDFGCGVGRLTQALAALFDSVAGVDIAPSMIEGARAYNRFGENCIYRVNDRPDLKCFPDGEFSFVLSLIVLQHVRPHYAKGYVREFLRVLKPGGMLVFQLPAVSLSPAGVAVDPDWSEPVAEMYGLPVSEVTELVAEHGGTVLRIAEADNDSPERSQTYFVEKTSQNGEIH